MSHELRFEEPYVSSNVEFSIHEDGLRIVLFSMDTSERIYLTANSGQSLREWLAKVLPAPQHSREDSK